MHGLVFFCFVLLYLLSLCLFIVICFLFVFVVVHACWAVVVLFDVLLLLLLLLLSFIVCSLLCCIRGRMCAVYVCVLRWHIGRCGVGCGELHVLCCGVVV